MKQNAITINFAACFCYCPLDVASSWSAHDFTKLTNALSIIQCQFKKKMIFQREFFKRKVSEILEWLQTKS